MQAKLAERAYELGMSPKTNKAVYRNGDENTKVIGYADFTAQKGKDPKEIYEIKPATYDSAIGRLVTDVQLNKYLDNTPQSVRGTSIQIGSREAPEVIYQSERLTLAAYTATDAPGYVYYTADIDLKAEEIIVVLYALYKVAKSLQPLLPVPVPNFGIE